MALLRKQLYIKKSGIPNAGKGLFTKKPIAKGTRIIEKPSQANSGETLVVRAHGVAAAVEEEIASMDIECCNATCPFVKKVKKNLEPVLK